MIRSVGKTLVGLIAGCTEVNYHRLRPESLLTVEKEATRYIFRDDDALLNKRR